jgi:Glycosyl hydrolases family 18
MEIHRTPSSSTSEPDVVADCDLVRQFIEHLFNPGHETDSPDRAPSERDWKAIQDAVAGSDSVERAIGRSVITADLIARGEYRDPSGSGGSESGLNLKARLSGHKGVTSAFLATSIIAITLTAACVSIFGGSPAHSTKLPRHLRSQGIEGNSQLLKNAELTDATPATTTSTTLPVATTPPAPAPPSLVNAPPLRTHEIFGFAPYWTLSESSGFDLSQISTIDYFSIGVNSDGSLDESGPGWTGYQSQDLASLITRAHAAGDRVVLTVSDFDQSSLDALTSSATAPATLAQALIAAIQAKNLDGANFDFEGQGDGDQAGLTNLVTQVSAAIHHVNPDYQVTMDTYASSAGDPNGFYNISALAPAVNAFFVMAYQLNLQSGTSSASPLTSTAFSEKTAIAQYTAIVPASKVLLGLPYFGIDWPTSDGTLTAQATGPATTVSYSQVLASGHPVYWDATTQTGWTSYEVGTQWHETFFEVPASLYDAAQLASSSGLGGMGIWALGMDGNDPAMTAAISGFSPAVKDYSAGPTTTSTSSTSTTTSTSTTNPTSTSTTSPTSTTTSTSNPTSTTSTAPSSTTSTTSTMDPSTTSTSTSSTVPGSGSTSTASTSTTSTSTPSTSTTSTTTTPQGRRPLSSSTSTTSSS